MKNIITRTEAVVAAALLLVLSAGALAQSEADFLDMPLEDLLHMEITSAAKKDQSIKETAASVFVITREDIHRAGVTSIPEALRLAPGVQVARIDSNKWAITTRGFNNQFVNMLLVMIDGRTVYSPTISGVYWDAQDTMLEDIERIEVVRGPGAALWGANAVNGVINIITRNAQDTEGGLLAVGGGNEQQGLVGLRYGAQLGEQAHGRLYFKYRDLDSFWSPVAGRDANDQWRSVQGGFRADGWVSGVDSWTFQGDIYRSDENQLANYWADPADPASAPYAPYYVIPLVEDAIESSGWNLLGRWNHQLAENSETSLQVYLDSNYRAEAFASQKHLTLDVDFQHHLQPLTGHDLVWGVNFRRIQDDYSGSFMASINPSGRNLNQYGIFLQDEISLSPEGLRLVLGSKFEHNEYTGVEIQPTARLLWLANDRTTYWTAVSRAVRMPSRVERNADIVFGIVPTMPPRSPLVIHAYGSDRFVSEKVLAYEFGLRYQPRDNLALDLVAYYQDYEDLETFERKTDPFGLPYLEFANKLSGDSQGLELSLDWQIMEWWRIQLGYSYFQIDTQLDQGSTLPGQKAPNGRSTPTHMGSIRSLMDICNDVSLDAWIYYNGAIDRPAFMQDIGVPAYTSLNLRLAWRPSEDLELSLVARDLLDHRHLEFVGESYLMPTEIERSLLARFQLRF